MNRDRNGYGSNEARWRAVLARDPGADGRFFYSVRTTGVYCRPTCSARRALRSNVEFHNSCDLAEEAGFRPCKRCRPREAAATSQHRETIARACALLESAEAVPPLKELAAEFGLSAFHFHRLFKKNTGITPKAYAKAKRAERVRKELLRRPTVTDAIYEAGYHSNSRFYEEAGALLGMKPGVFRSGGKGEVIRFSIASSSLGFVLVAASQRGVCAILIGEGAADLVEDLRRRFSHAELVAGDGEFEALVARVVALVEHPGSQSDLPLDLRGTAFQRRVWEALREVPAGSTVSYSDLAKRLGIPRSVRAVASACAANSVAIAVPCHRVVRSNGELSGYRWGVERKRALLRKEAS